MRAIFSASSKVVNFSEQSELGLISAIGDIIIGEGSVIISKECRVVGSGCECC